MKIAIGSASKNAKTVIEKLGLAEHMDALVKPLGTRIADGYSVDRPKPAPTFFCTPQLSWDLTLPTV